MSNQPFHDVVLHLAVIPRLRGKNTRIEIDGMPIHNVSDVTVMASHDGPTKITLEFMANIVPAPDGKSESRDGHDPWHVEEP